MVTGSPQPNLDLRPATPVRHGWRKVLVALGLLAGLVPLLWVAGALAVWLHFRGLPTFEAFVREVRAEAPAVPDTELLARDGNWSVGGDPLAIDESQRDGCILELAVGHGADDLLRLRHAVDSVLPEDGRRASFALRTLELQTTPDWRALVRVYVEEQERPAGDGLAAGVGVTWDVFLLAGAGASEVQVLRASPPAEPQLPCAVGPIPPWKIWWTLSTNMLDPWPELPSEGLVHRVRANAHLSASAGHGPGQRPVRHWVSTHVYSYSLQVKCESISPGGRMTLESNKDHDLTWNGATW